MKLTRNGVFTIFVGLIMVTSTIGYALLYTVNGSGGTAPKIEDVYTKPLTSAEKIYILKSGRVLIEYFYNGTPEDIEKNRLYEGFAGQFKGFVVLESFEVAQENQTKDEMINPQGDITPLYNVTTSQGIMDVFCAQSIIQPRECLLRGL
jgi:hypothetical protein